MSRHNVNIQQLREDAFFAGAWEMRQQIVIACQKSGKTALTQFAQEIMRLPFPKHPEYEDEE